MGTNKDSYEDFIKLSKDIGKLKKTQEDAFNNFIKFKQEYAESSKLLKEKLEKLNGFAEVESNDRRRKNNDKEKRGQAAHQGQCKESRGEAEVQEEINH